MLERNDEKLISEYLKGDEKSLEVLIKQYLKPIYSFVYHYVGNTTDAEDITQEIFVKMWRNIKKFDQHKNFKTWIFTIAKNASIDFFKKKKTLPFSALENSSGDNAIVDALADTSLLPDELVERADKTHALASVLKKITPKYLKVLLMRYNDELTFSEISEFLGESINTIKSRHRRALFFLKKKLTEAS